MKRLRFARAGSIGILWVLLMAATFGFAGGVFGKLVSEALGIQAEKPLAAELNAGATIPAVVINPEKLGGYGFTGIQHGDKVVVTVLEKDHRFSVALVKQATGASLKSLNFTVDQQGRVTVESGLQGGVLQGNADMVRCRIAGINLKTGVVISSIIDGGTTPQKAPSSGQSFQFFVKDAALLNSLKQGQVIFANFKNQEVFTSAGASGQGVRLGAILTNSFGTSSAGPTGGKNPQPSKAGELGNAVNPRQPNCLVTGINAATGVVSAKNLSTGQTFQFTVQNSALFRSFQVGQRFFANFNSRQVSLDGKTFSGIQSVGGSLPN